MALALLGDSIACRRINKVARCQSADNHTMVSFNKQGKLQSDESNRSWNYYTENRLCSGTVGFTMLKQDPSAFLLLLSLHTELRVRITVKNGSLNDEPKMIIGAQGWVEDVTLVE